MPVGTMIRSALHIGHWSMLLSVVSHTAGYACLLIRGFRACDRLPESLQAPPERVLTSSESHHHTAVALPDGMAFAAEEIQEVAAQADTSLPAHEQLRICIMTADFWGLKSAGGTATAYHLLAAALSSDVNNQVTFVPLTRRMHSCQEAAKLHTGSRVAFACLSKADFEPLVVPTAPYEQLSHAALSWVTAHQEMCDVLHVHEWGGTFVDLITAVHLRQLKPGLRIAVEPHGGHVWSQLGEKRSSVEVGVLRTDHHERMASQLADIEISPTHYMTSYLRQRGWSLPADVQHIPNVLAERVGNTTSLIRPVWRIAFFGRVEERKGIKIFVDAVSRLNVTGLARFEVFIVGQEAEIDMIPSSRWLQEHTSKWTEIKLTTVIGSAREEATKVVEAEGVLLVLCSQVDNMPYVVAEAAVNGLPFVAFDAGGVLELFDYAANPQAIVWDPSGPALAARLQKVLTDGQMQTVQLHEHFLNGRERWLEWHTDFAVNTLRLQEEDQLIHAAVNASLMQAPPIQIVPVTSATRSLDIWREWCPAESHNASLLLLLPAEYQLLRAADQALPDMARLMAYTAARNSSIGAMTFGARLPNGKLAYPSSPTWILYSGDDEHCIDNVPVLIPATSFCSSFLGEARLFPHYAAWILAMLLGRSDLQLHTYPKPMFRASRPSVTSRTHCGIESIPKARGDDYRRAANHLFRDADDMLRNVQMLQRPRALVSLLGDAPIRQRHMGWEIGYRAGGLNKSDAMNPLTWQPAKSGEALDGKWGCSDITQQYPAYGQQLLHPCASLAGACCDGLAHASLLLRLTTFFHVPEAIFILTYDSFPVCGDGVDVTVQLHAEGSMNHASKVLLQQSHEPLQRGAKPMRTKVQKLVTLQPGDQVDVLVEPRTTHDCDGIFIVEMDVWDAKDIA